MIMHWVLLAWCSGVAFLLGGVFAAWVEHERRGRTREQVLAEQRRLFASVAGYMQSGNLIIETFRKTLEAHGAARAAVSVDWDLLRNAANGAGFTLVKDPAPRAGAKVN